MPAFRADSDELDAYLLRFERHATLCKWPKDCWASALGNLLTGRALDVYAQMSADDVLDYPTLKTTLLQHHINSFQAKRTVVRASALDAHTCTSPAHSCLL